MSFRLLKEYLFGKKDTAQAVSESPRVFPAGNFHDLRLGANVDFSPALAKFILAQNAGLSFKAPSDPLRVVSYGSMQETEGMLIHRFYLGKPGTDPNYLLEIAVQNGNVVDGEIKLYQFLTEITPSTPEEWNMWFSGTDGNPPLLGGITLDWQDVSYGRVWGVDDSGNGADTIPPRVLTETTHESSGATDDVTLSAMLYGRMVGEKDPMPEWLLVAVMQQDKDSVTSRWIEAYLGVTLVPGEFTIY